MVIKNFHFIDDHGLDYAGNDSQVSFFTADALFSHNHTPVTWENKFDV